MEIAKLLNPQPTLCELMSTDCWMEVLDHLELEDILSVFAVSWDLCASTRPSMYGTISWEWNTVPVARILRLLRFVLHCPGLASNIQHVKMLSSVRHIHMEIWEDDQDESHWNQDLLDLCFGDVIKQSQSIIDKVRFPEPSKWIDALQKCNRYALVAILLSQLPNLRTLRLDYSFIWKSGFPGLMLRHSLFSAPKGILSSFNSLHTIDYGSNVPRPGELDPQDGYFYTTNGYPSCDPNQFMAWFHLPSIQSLSIWLRSFQDVITCKDQGNLSNLHTLVAARSTIKEEGVSRMLSQMASLKVLHLGMVYECNSEEALEECWPILEGLESISDTIEKLSLGIDYYESAYPQDEWARNQFQGFLKKFPRLRSAEVPASLLFGLKPTGSPDIGRLLPNTLEELCLRWDSSEFDSTFWENIIDMTDCVEYLLTDLRSHSPNLKNFTIRIMKHRPSDEEEPLSPWHKEVDVMFTKTGVSLGFVSGSPLPGLWT